MPQAKLMRSESDKMIAGVSGGVAAYLGVDSVFVRLAFILLCFASGIGFLLYLVLLVIMPSEANVDSPPSKVVQDNVENLGSNVTAGVERISQHPQGPTIAAGLLILMGCFFLLRELGWLSWLGSGLVWPILLIALGVLLIYRRNNLH